jgi:branched-chain amino acid transport system permease protein
MTAKALRATALDLAGPIGLLVVVGVIGSTVSETSQIDVISILVQATMVIAIYVFAGNSGVISFGHIAFVAAGAFVAGVLTIPALVKPTLLPDLFGVLSDHTVSPLASLLIATALGAAVAVVFGLALMRLSGLAAGIATLGMLEIVHNLLRYWEKIGPGAKTLSLVPVTTKVFQATLGAVAVAVIAYIYQRSRSGRLLRATREDPAAAQAAGIRIFRERLKAFVLSGALAGFAGGQLVHSLGSITTEQVYLSLTFLTLAMLVVGGMGSLWGATVGAVLISFLDIELGKAENGLSVGFATINLPDGISFVILGAIMLIILILRPTGLTGGRELGSGRAGGLRRQAPRPPVATPAPRAKV